MRHRIVDLGGLNQTCSTHLFQNFARAGIAPWWVKTSAGPKGGAVFAYYDAKHTCLRLTPGAPRFFQAALRSELLSHAEATLLGRELIATVDGLLKRYSGAYLSELKDGRVGEIIRQASEPDGFSFYEAHQNLVPDEIYAAMPWPCIPEMHFKLGKFSPAGIRRGYIADAAEEDLRALTIAVDVTTLGPAANLSAGSILTLLRWLARQPNGQRTNDFPADESIELKKILIPSFSSGFQGIAFGLFKELPVELEEFVIGKLLEFAATLGERVARHREQHYIKDLERCTSLTDYADAFIRLLPPVEHVVFTAGADQLGYRLIREGRYLAGYRKISGEELKELHTDPLNETLATRENEARVEIHVKLCSDQASLSPVFTILRQQSGLAVLPSAISQEPQTLGKAELNALHQDLQRQINESHGAIVASKKLFFVDLVLKHYDDGEITLSNRKARDYTERLLGKPIAGYHVTGKAAKKFEADIEKMLPGRFQFEPMSTHAIRVRWRPYLERYGSSKQFGL